MDVHWRVVYKVAEVGGRLTWHQPCTSASSTEYCTLITNQLQTGVSFEHTVLHVWGTAKTSNPRFSHLDPTQGTARSGAGQ